MYVHLVNLWHHNSFMRVMTAIIVITLADAEGSPRVAVVGAGVGGAFTSVRLMEMARESVQPDIDVYEAGGVEGGRVQELQYGGEAFELGASIFWEYNKYVKTAAEKLGLNLRSPRGSQDSPSSQGDQHRRGPVRLGPVERAESGFAVWNGTSFVLNMTGSWRDMVYAGLRYGTAALRYRWLVAAALRRFQQVYDMQSGGTAWERPEGLLGSLGLYNYTQQRCADYMRDWLQQPAWWLWGGAAFSDEVAGAINRCNYNQDNEHMNAFACLVSYAPAAYGSVWQIEGGNRQLVSGLLAASGARLISSARVVGVIRRPSDGRYLLRVALERQGTQEQEAAGGLAQGDDEEGRRDEPDIRVAVVGPYDAVVLAAPLLGSQLQLHLHNITSAATTTTPTTATATASPSESVFAASTLATATATATAAADARSLLATSRDQASDCAKASILPSAAAADPAAISETTVAAGATAASAPFDSPALLQQPYQVTVTTYVAAGRLRPAFFGVVRMPPVSAVLVASSADAPFSAVSLQHVGEVSDGAEERVYKIFSRQELSQSLLAAMFEDGPRPPRLLNSRRWYAYPRFRPPERFTRFLLAPGLVYGNALEPAASAMEVSAIAATNSALLVLRHLESLGPGAGVPDAGDGDDGADCVGERT